MKIIPIEYRSSLVCSCCGENRSVKYEIGGKFYCNKCVTISINNHKEKINEPKAEL